MKRSRSNAAGKRPIVQNITINKINKTINNYFAPKPGPTTAPEASSSQTTPLFPRKEKEVFVPFHNGGLYRSVISKDDGTLAGDCGNCKQQNFAPISNFAPG